MTNEQTSEKKPESPYWLKQPSFWRDVTTRTISGVIVAAIIYVFGVSFGYIQQPGAITNVTNIFGWIIFAFAGFTFVWGVVGFIYALIQKRRLIFWIGAMVQAAIIMTLIFIDETTHLLLQ